MNMRQFEQLTSDTAHIVYTYFDSFAIAKAAQFILFTLQNSKAEHQMHRHKIESHGNQPGVRFR